MRLRILFSAIEDCWGLIDLSFNYWSYVTKLDPSTEAYSMDCLYTLLMGCGFGWDKLSGSVEPLLILGSGSKGHSVQLTFF